MWMWNLGFSCGMSLFMQMMTGMLLAFRYETKEANMMVEEMESMYKGWMWSSMHSTGSTLYFLTMYMHMLSSIMSSCNMYTPWITGSILYIVSFTTALMGYSLTSGNMAQWALTVVSSLVINFPKGNTMFKMMMGDNGMSEKMIPSIYTMHFLLGIMTPIIMMMHMKEVHKKEFSSDLNVSNSMLNKEFMGSGMMKDTLLMPMLLMMYNQGFKENSFMWKLIEDMNANDWPQMDSTPEPMGPEWYVLFMFATLKMTKLKYMMMGTMMMMMALSKKYNKIMFPMMMIGKLTMLGYLALNAHMSMEEPIIMSKNILLLSYIMLLK